MPIGLIVRRRRLAPCSATDAGACEAVANGNGPPLGRELEIADLLRFVQGAAHQERRLGHGRRPLLRGAPLRPERAQFNDFTPFWEFVAGPAHAGTFLPNALDDTFGPEVRFTGVPKGMKPNRPPTDGYQFFGTLKIDSRSQTLTVRLHNLKGETIFKRELEPERT